MNSKFNYGAVFKITREDTLDSIKSNLKQMKENGFNTIVVWPAFFWWEEKNPDYPFATGKKTLKFAEEIGIKVVMELAGQLTAMEYAPDFLMKEEYFPLDQDHHREWAQGSFGFLNYYHPEVKELVISHFKAAAKAYKDSPALLSYDIFNETMFRSFDDYSKSEFQKWLKTKYKTIEKLNAVWERTYKNFEQISFEKWKWMSVMPVADYNAFRRESIAIILKDWYAAVKSVDPNHPIMADNVYAQSSPLGLYFRPQDDYGMKTAVDEIGMSFYPKQKNGTFEPALRHNIFDGFYSASNGDGFWIAEMQTHNQSIFAPTTCVDPKELKQWCLEGYSAGAKSLIYWMWRPFNKGIQTLGRGLVNYKNQPTERLEVAAELSKLFSETGIIKPLKSEIAILYDPITEDIVRLISTAPELEQNLYNLSLFGAYKAFLKNNQRPDIITFESISDYKAIILSHQAVISQENGKKLIDYVKNGGIIIADGSFGITDELSLANANLPGGILNTIVGEELFDFDNNSADFEYKGEIIKGSFGRNLCKITDGKVISNFTDGLPSIVEKEFGKGKVITINTSAWYGYSEDEENEFTSAEVFAKLLSDEICSNKISTDLDLTLRIAENEEYYFIFAFNYSGSLQKGEIRFEGNINATVNISVDAIGTEIIKLKKAVN